MTLVNSGTRYRSRKKLMPASAQLHKRSRSTIDAAVGTHGFAGDTLPHFA
jgi:hypothetical protein